MKLRVRFAALAIAAAGLMAAGTAGAYESCYFTGGGCGMGTVAGGGTWNGYWTGTYYTYGFRTYSGGPHYAKGGWVYRASQGQLGPWYGGSGTTMFTKTFDYWRDQKHACGNWGPGSMPISCSMLY